MTEQDNMTKAQELKREAEQWVGLNFNFIQLEVFEAMAEKDGGMLHEYIQPDSQEDLLEDFASKYREEVEDVAKTFFVALKAEEATFDEWFGENRDEVILYEMSTEFYFFCEEQEVANYPMWNTLFEFRSEPLSEWVEKARVCGFGVIDAFGPFKTTLFVAGAGYSFYGQHWIPLYKRLGRKVRQCGFLDDVSLASGFRSES